MIFRSVVFAMVVATAASALIRIPTTTQRHELFNVNNEPTTNATQEDTITTIKPAVKITTVKPAAPVPAQAPMISCYCNLPECSVAAGGDGTCSTRLGCYSEVQPIIPGIEEEIMTPAVTESNNTVNGSAVSPIIPELDESPVAVTTEHASTIRGSFGCLDQLNFAKQSCEEILKSMEAEASEFPTIQVPTNGAVPSAINDGVHAFHCCQTQRCNGNQSGPAEGSVKSAQAVLVAELKNTVASQAVPLGVQNSTVGVPWTPAVSSSIDSSVNSSVNASASNADFSNTRPIVSNVEYENVKKIKSESSDLWSAYFGINTLGQPKAPSAFQSDKTSESASSIEAKTPAVPDPVPPTLPVAVPDKQEITHDETVSHVSHVVNETVGHEDHVVNETVGHEDHVVNETVGHVHHVVNETVGHVGHVVIKRHEQQKGM